MHDQADQLRKLVREAVAAHGDLAPGAPIVAISGGASGVGVTTAACGLARELARFGKHVIVVDANLVHPGVAQAFNAAPVGSLAEILAGARCAVEVLAPVAEGIRIVAGAPPQSGLADRFDHQSLDRLLDELAALSRQADIVIVDAGHGMTPWVDRLWQAARQVFLLATPENDAVLGAYAAVKLARHDRLEARLRLVINRAASDELAAGAAARFGKTCRRFLGVVTQRHSVLSESPQRDLASPNADDPFRRAVRLLAADLAGDCRVLSHRIPAAVTLQRVNRLLAPQTPPASTPTA